MLTKGMAFCYVGNLLIWLLFIGQGTPKQAEDPRLIRCQKWELQMLKFAFYPFRNV